MPSRSSRLPVVDGLGEGELRGVRSEASRRQERLSSTRRSLRFDRCGPTRPRHEERSIHSISASPLVPSTNFAILGRAAPDRPAHFKVGILTTGYGESCSTIREQHATAHDLMASGYAGRVELETAAQSSSRLDLKKESGYTGAPSRCQVHRLPHRRPPHRRDQRRRQETYSARASSTPPRASRPGRAGSTCQPVDQ